MVQHFIFDLNPIRERERERDGWEEEKVTLFHFLFYLRVHGDRE